MGPNLVTLYLLIVVSTYSVNYPPHAVQAESLTFPGKLTFDIFSFVLEASFQLLCTDSTNICNIYIAKIPYSTLHGDI